MADATDYAWLIGDLAAAHLTRHADDGRTELQQLATLRRELPAERARLVVEQIALRKRGAEKFGSAAARMFFTSVLLEQATDLWIAQYKAERFAASRRATIADYCCGVGGDLLALASGGAATGWDISEIACLLAAANVPGAAGVTCGDVELQTPARDEAWHLDPDRRPGGRRSTLVTACAPGPDLVDRWLVANSCGAVKLAPAAEAPAAWQDNAELEWITRDRECRQQVAWFGPLAAAAGRRRATVVDRNGELSTLEGEPHAPCDVAETPGEFLYDPDPSVLAADLLGTLAEKFGWSSLGAGGAYLTGGTRVDDSLAAGFVVHDCLPLRPATLQKYLAARGVGRVEIKKRGVAIEPETLRRQLKLRGDNAATLILTRIGKREAAIVAERFSS